MARRRKNRKEELAALAAPEIVEEKLWSLSDWMEAHWRPVLTGLVTMSVLWGAVGIYQIVTASQEQSRAAATAAVFEQSSVAIIAAADKKAAEEAADKEDAESDKAEGKDDEKAKAKAAEKARRKANEPPSFPTEKERAEAVLKAVDAEGKAQPLVAVLVGAAQAATGDFAAQLAALDAALGKSGGDALELPLRVQRAQALAALGKTADAAAEWTKVQALDPTTFGKALAQARQGDLFNPTGNKAGDAGKAKAAYEAALATARVGDKDPAAGPLGFLVADVRMKIARL